MAISAMTDFALGIFATWAVVKIYHREPTLWLYAAGALFAVLPDVSIIIKKLRFRSKAGTIDFHHKEITHHFVPVLLMSLVWGYLVSPFWASLFCMSVMLHFIHDSIGEDAYGLLWLAPFMSKRVLFLTRKGDGKFKVIAFFSEEEIQTIMKDGIAGGLDYWLERYWLRPTKLSVIGLVLLCQASLMVFPLKLAIVISYMMALATVAVWGVIAYKGRPG